MKPRHYGLAVSICYADPDGNQLEFQVGCFASTAESNASIRSPSFSSNPVSRFAAP
jgi:hypothetical protein